MDRKFQPKTAEQAKDAQERLETAVKAFEAGLKLLQETMDKDYQVKFVLGLDHGKFAVTPCYFPENTKEYADSPLVTE